MDSKCWSRLWKI